MGEQVIGHGDVTASWINALFVSKGMAANVTSVSAAPIGTGQVGSTFRYRLTYDGDGAGGDTKAMPASIVGKFQSDNPVSREGGKTTLTYLREASFYRLFGSRKPLPIPEMLHLEFDDDSHEFALIMSDLPDYVVGNQLGTPSAREAALAIDAAATIHAAWWQDPVLDTHSWLNGARTAIPPYDIEELYSALWPAFCDRYSRHITSAIRQVGDAFVGNIGQWQTRLGQAPRCLVHNDFRPDNMLFAPGDASRPVIILDWQTTGVGCGATDIAYYIGTSFDPDQRARVEADLLERYTVGLLRAGVAQNDLADLSYYFGLSSFAGFLMGVTASMIVQQTDRGDAMFLAMCQRAAAMCLDHNAAHG